MLGVVAHRETGERKIVMVLNKTIKKIKKIVSKREKIKLDLDH